MTNLWQSTVVDMGVNATSDGAAFASNNLLFMVGGYNQDYSEYSNKLISLDTTSLTFNYGLPPMPTGRGDISVQAMANGDQFYVIGGWLPTSFCEAATNVEMYSVSANSWTIKSPMLFGRGDMAVGVMGESIFAIAGETKSADCNHSVPVPYVSRFNIFSGKPWVVESGNTTEIFYLAHQT
jgi:hypothetical protein